MIGIVVLHYGSPDLTIECISSILASAGPDVRVFLVENSLEAGTAGCLRDWCAGKPIVVAAVQENTGFCRGTNIGTRAALEAGCDYVLWLNNDTHVNPDCLPALVERARLVGDGCVVTGKICYAHDPNLIWYAGGYLDHLAGVGKHIGHRQIDKGQWDEPRVVDYVTGCLTLIPRRVFEKVGFLNERLFTYMDDTEFSFRLAHQRIPIWYEPKAKILHKIGSGVSLKTYSPLYLYLTTRNRPYVTRNFLYRFYLRWITFGLTCLKVLILAGPGTLGRSRKIKALLAGLVDSCRLARAPWKGPAWIHQPGR